MGRNRYDGVCQNNKNILTLDGVFLLKSLKLNESHQTTHLKLVILWQITCTQSF